MKRKLNKNIESLLHKLKHNTNVYWDKEEGDSYLKRIDDKSKKKSSAYVKINYV